MLSFGARGTIGVLGARGVGVLAATVGLLGLWAIALVDSAAAALPPGCFCFQGPRSRVRIPAPGPRVLRFLPGWIRLT